MWVRSLGWEDSLAGNMATYSSILAGESHAQRSLMGYSPQGRQELDMTEATEHVFMLRARSVRYRRMELLGSWAWNEDNRWTWGREL